MLRFPVSVVRANPFSGRLFGMRDVDSARRSRSQQARAVPERSVDECRKLLAGGGYTYLDVRTPEEWQADHVDPSVNIPVMLRTPSGMAPNTAFLGEVEAQFPDKETALLVGCKAGPRSTRACQMLESEGYINLVNVAGGFDAWKAS